jgi:2-C-methyl-D-erythritol 4-phosphate cytidylyltransferase
MSAAGPFADVGLVVAAAGSGSRYSRERSKLFEPLGGEPLFLRCIRSFAAVIPADSIVLVVSAAAQDRFRQALDALPDGARITVVTGADSRAGSVQRGIEALPAAATLVAVQDAARPLTPVDLLCRCIAAARHDGSGVAARRVTDTIKVADPAGRVTATPDRASLWAAETPQVFRRADLHRAYAEALHAGRHPTDEASAVEALGLPVHLVESLRPNPKVTHSHDTAVVRLLLGQEPTA